MITYMKIFTWLLFEMGIIDTCCEIRSRGKIFSVFPLVFYVTMKTRDFNDGTCSVISSLSKGRRENTDIFNVQCTSFLIRYVKFNGLILFSENNSFKDLKLSLLSPIMWTCYTFVIFHKRRVLVLLEILFLNTIFSMKINK